jgi:mannose-6-phosphate isomerase
LFKIPSLRPFVPDGVDKWTDETLRSVVKNILKADELIIKRVEKELFLHLSKGGDSEALLSSEMQDQIFKLLPRLQDQYTATDPGSLVALLCMNYLVLERGDSVFIPADGIHAYLSGDIVECMARSNNMLAAGLCPAADRNSIDLFAKTLTFSSETKDFGLPAKSTSDGLNGHTTVYQPPISEFDMLRTILATNEEERLRSHNGPKVAIVVSGSGKVSGDGKDLEAKEGFIFYIAPGIETVWTAESEMEIFTAVVRTTET